MAFAEKHTEVFIVRFWREPSESSTGRSASRGVVEHLKSGTRRFVQRPEEVTFFIATYVTPDPASATVRARVRRWLRKHWERAC